MGPREALSTGQAGEERSVWLATLAVCPRYHHKTMYARDPSRMF